ncbi:MAG: prolipoprotein diacylglyceryl transferase [Planctomycetes bacterium]|nr:prolipoprotein diacylglyceryl transferase [Planctomycetota bacterium]
MHPTLFVHFIHSYGLMLAVGFYAGWWLAARRGRAAGIHSDVIGNMILISIVAGVVGARLLWFALHRGPNDSVWMLFEVWRGGLVFYGGLIAALAADYLYLRARRLPPWEVADVVAPAVALGQAFGRIGCFLNGCCYGGMSTADFILRVRFPGHLYFAQDGRPVAEGSPPFCDHVMRFDHDRDLLGSLRDTGASLPVHPAQLYEAASLFLICALLVAATPYKRRHGELFGLLCVLNAVSRFGVELVRRDTSPVALGLSAGQVGAVAVLAVGAAILAWARILRRTGAAPASP